MHVHLVAGGQPLGLHGIEAGLGLAHIGDGDQAHIKIALGQGGLLGHRVAQGGLHLQYIVRLQDVHIGLGHLQQQALPSGCFLGLGQLQGVLALAVLGQVGGAVQRLAQGNAGTALPGGQVVRLLALRGAQAHFTVAVLGARLQANLR